MSHDKGSVIWPLVQIDESPLGTNSDIARSARAEYYDFIRHTYATFTKISVTQVSSLLFIALLVLIHLVGMAIAAFIPGGWIVSEGLKHSERWVLGIDITVVTRIMSFSMSRSMDRKRNSVRAKFHRIYR